MSLESRDKMATAEFFRGEDPTTKEKWYASKRNPAVRYSIGKRGDGYRVEDRMRGEYAITATAQEARELARWLAGHEDHGNYEADPTTFYEWWGFDGEKKGGTTTSSTSAEATQSGHAVTVFGSEGCTFDSAAPAAQATVAEEETSLYQQRRDYLFGLPDWDGVDRIGQLVEHLCTDPKANRLEVRADIETWLVTVAAKMHSPHNGFDRVLVLKGSCGIGKSHLVRWLCPKEEWHENTGAMAWSRERNPDVLVCEVTNYPERIVWNLRVANKGKGRVLAVTTQTIERPFLEAMAIAEDLFLPIPLRSIDRGYTAIDKAQLWAQVYDRAKQGPLANTQPNVVEEGELDEQVAADLCGGDDPPPAIEHCEDEYGPYIRAWDTLRQATGRSWNDFEQKGF
jgi:hypothetical protein